jgi:hypothetical protein
MFHTRDHAQSIQRRFAGLQHLTADSRLLWAYNPQIWLSHIFKMAVA